MGWRKQFDVVKRSASLALLSLFLLSCAGAARAPEQSPAPAPTPPAIELRVFAARDPLAERAIEIAVNGFAGLRPEAKTTVIYAEPDPVVQLKQLASGGALPDVLWMTGTLVQPLADAGLLMNLQDLASLDRNVDPRSPEGCSCVRPLPPFRLTNIETAALSASRPISGSGLYMIPALITGTLKGRPQVMGFGIAASTRQIEAAWAFVRYMATQDAQNIVVAHGLGKSVLRSASPTPEGSRK